MTDAKAKKKKKKSPKLKPTEFCSAAVGRGYDVYACMRPATAVHGGRGFCPKHAPAQETFFVYRVHVEDMRVEQVLVSQIPGSNAFHVVNPKDRRCGATLWPKAYEAAGDEFDRNHWFRTFAAARAARLKDVRSDVRYAEKELAARKRELRQVLNLRAPKQERES